MSSAAKVDTTHVALAPSALPAGGACRTARRGDFAGWLTRWLTPAHPPSKVPPIPPQVRAGCGALAQSPKLVRSFLVKPLRTTVSDCSVSLMETTQTTQTLRLIAARINRGDSLDMFDTGEFRTVDTVALVNCRVVVEYVDGTVASIEPHRYVEVAA